jgi:glycosyltransferase involved in cell wall biosynthesis
VDVLPRAESVDVMLILEGTFPYVSGGVSSWVNQIIRGFPEHRFGAIFLGSRAQDYGAMRYPMPPNLVHLEVHYVQDLSTPPAAASHRGDSAAFELNAQLHETLRAARGAPGADPTAAAGALLRRVVPQLSDGAKLSERSFLYSERAWSFVTDQYRRFCTDPSFVDYFWTVRIMHAPIWMLARIAERSIPAGCYHTISTGYAGMLGAMLRQRTGRRLILSEHGIYTKERKIDLFQSTWIADNRGVFDKDAAQVAYFREMWVRFFETVGRMCYDASDRIVALYEANRQRQIADGAPQARTSSIANGIDLPRFAALRARRGDDPPPVLCLIGRVVPIKDVKTFIRALRTVVDRLPGAQGWIAGPEDEDPAYAQECHAVAAGLGLQDSVKFLGFQKVDDILPRVGLIVLSSISEALPLVLLEGFAAGVPAVATDVGSCRQLVHGLAGDDAAIGAAGDVVRIADPEALAEAALRLLGNPQAWRAAQRAGIERVETRYTQELMFARYRELYDWALRDPQGAAPGVG